MDATLSQTNTVLFVVVFHHNSTGNPPFLMACEFFNYMNKGLFPDLFYTNTDEYLGM